MSHTSPGRGEQLAQVVLGAVLLAGGLVGLGGIEGHPSGVIAAATGFLGLSTAIRGALVARLCGEGLANDDDGCRVLRDPDSKGGSS